MPLENSSSAARWLSTAVCAASLLVGCGSSDSTSGNGGAAVTPTFDFSTFDAAVNQFLTDNGIEGASAIVVHQDYGVLHTMGYGSYDADRL